MNITQAREDVRNVHNQLDQARQRGRELANDPNASAADMEAQASTIRQLTARLALMQQELQDAEHSQAVQVPARQPAPTNNRLRDMLCSNEYARAFASAVRQGVTPKTGRGMEQYNVLYDALTIGGGDTPGEDGGFLVPEDIDHQIRELRRTLNPLSDLFSVESVGTNSGWRVMDNAPTTGMVAVEEMGEIQSNDQPLFSRVTFKLAKYALWIPVSNELASDEIANLFGYLSRWFAKKAVITENSLLLDALSGLVAQDVAAGGELRALKTALNVALDPAIALNAAILTNQSGFNALDCLTDETGRPLLNPDPKTGTPKLANGRTVHVVSDAVLPNPSEGRAPLYIGDMKQYATLFRRNPLEILSTNIGGSAWRTDSIEVRGIQRMGVSKFDPASVVLRTIPTDGAAAAAVVSELESKDPTE